MHQFNFVILIFFTLIKCTNYSTMHFNQEILENFPRVHASEISKITFNVAEKEVYSFTLYMYLSL